MNPLHLMTRRHAERKEAEAAAALFQLNKEKRPKSHEYRNMTLSEAIDAYIESREAINRSPTTIQDYRCIQKNAFQDIMDSKLKDLDEEILQEAINVEAGGHQESAPGTRSQYHQNV